MAFRPDSGYRIPRSEVARLLNPPAPVDPAGIDFTKIFLASARNFGVGIDAIFRGYKMVPVKLEILDVIEQSGVAKATGRPYQIHRAQCVLHGADGNRKIGELNLPRDLAETKPGVYMASFELSVSMDRLIVPRIIALTPFGASPVLPLEKAK